MSDTTKDSHQPPQDAATGEPATQSDTEQNSGVPTCDPQEQASASSRTSAFLPAEADEYLLIAALAISPEGTPPPPTRAARAPAQLDRVARLLRHRIQSRTTGATHAEDVSRPAAR